MFTIKSKNMVKLVTEQEWDLIHSAICTGENIPRVDPNGYRVDRYLDKYTCFDSVHGYYIPQDHITEKYTSGFIGIELTHDAGII